MSQPCISQPRKIEFPLLRARSMFTDVEANVSVRKQVRRNLCSGSCLASPGALPFPCTPPAVPATN